MGGKTFVSYGSKKDLNDRCKMGRVMKIEYGSIHHYS